MPLRKRKQPEVPLFWDHIIRLLAAIYAENILKRLLKAAYPIQTYCLDLRLRIYRVITFRMVPAPFLREPHLMGSAKSGQAALKMATRVGDLSRHLLSSKKRSFASSPPQINCCPIPGGRSIYHGKLMANSLFIQPSPPSWKWKCVALLYINIKIFVCVRFQDINALMSGMYRTAGRKNASIHKKENKKK